MCTSCACLRISLVALLALIVLVNSGSLLLVDDSGQTPTPPCVVNDDDLSCSYNGVCIQSQQTTACRCDPGWTGVYCEALDLVPVRNGSGLQDMLMDQEQRTSTWGGSVVWSHQDGLYHMWFSEMAEHCGIHRWVSNSVVSHAVSRGAKDHWKFAKTHTLLPIFSHEPIIAVAHDHDAPNETTYALFVSHYPNGSASDGPVCTCLDGSTASALDPSCIGEAGVGKNKTQLTYFVTASHPMGPWSPLHSLEEATPVNQRHIDLNFAPLILSNGSLVAWTRWDIWTANDWKDPSTYIREGQAPNFSNPNGQWEGEDPSMWRDAKGRFHILSHNGPRGKEGPAGDCGRHLFSATGEAGSWLAAPLPLGGCTYPRVNVSFADGTNKTFYRRERPHLIFNAHGVPVALSTAVIDSPVGPGVPGYKAPQRDASYTMIQAIRSGIMEEAEANSCL